MSTHVPCFPVKPWNSTFVSLLMRRFLMVSAYCEEPVAYCLVADLVSAERRGCRRACIVAMKLSRRQSYVYGRISRIGVVGGAGFERAATHIAGFLRLQLGPVSKLNPMGPVRARTLHENTSFFISPCLPCYVMSQMKSLQWMHIIVIHCSSLQRLCLANRPTMSFRESICWLPSSTACTH
jgi:hypothetical protein